MAAAAVTALALAGCATATSAATLENTYWKLLRARGETVTVAEGQREPHLLLQGPQRGLAGFSGCNRLGGSYGRGAAAAIHFEASLLTRSACDGAAALHEKLFLDALARATAWRIAGDRLELLDGAGAVLAGFESVYLR